MAGRSGSGGGVERSDGDVRLSATVGAAVAIAAAYLLGSIPTAYVLVRVLRNADIRSLGSKNVGATNAGRVLGPAGFLATLAGDMGKGAAAVLLANALRVDHSVVWLVVPTVIVGHIWPVTLGFHGGKGVAPGIGALSLAAPDVLVPALLVFGVMFLASRRYQLSGLVSITVVPVIAFVRESDPTAMIGLAVTVLLVLLAHREDIRELVSRRS